MARAAPLLVDDDADDLDPVEALELLEHCLAVGHLRHSFG